MLVLVQGLNQMSETKKTVNHLEIFGMKARRTERFECENKSLHVNNIKVWGFGLNTDDMDYSYISHLTNTNQLILQLKLLDLFCFYDDDVYILYI